MGAKFWSDSPYMDYTPATDVDAYDGVVIGKVVGFARKDITANTLGQLTVGGGPVMKVDATGGSTGQAFTKGCLVYWDATNEVATTTAGSNVLLGIAEEAAASTQTYVLVRLMPAMNNS